MQDYDQELKDLLPVVECNYAQKLHWLLLVAAWNYGWRLLQAVEAEFQARQGAWRVGG